MSKGERLNVSWVVPKIALLLMLFLLIASGSQPSPDEGYKSSYKTGDQQSNIFSGNASVLMQTSGIENAITDLNAFSPIAISFNIYKNSSFINSQRIITGNDTAKSILLRANDTSNDKVRYEIISQPSHGIISGTAPNIIYVPEESYSGNDSFTFSASDETGNKQIVAVPIEVVQLYHPPNVMIRSPQNGMIFTADDTGTAEVLIHATATGDVMQVTFFDGPDLLETVDCPPGDLLYWFLPGTHTLTAVVTDSYGKTCISLPVVIIVNPPEPVVKITSPADGQIFIDPTDISITAQVSGSSPVKKVEFFANSQSLGVVNDAPYQLDWTDIIPGAYHLVAKATDENDNVSISNTVFIIVLPANPTSKSNLVLTMSSTPASVRRGGNFNYVLTVTNRGPDSATDVVATDLLPDEVNHKSFKATQGNYDSSSGIWDLGGLNKYHSARLVITVNVPTGTAPGQIFNTADVGGGEYDPEDYNNHATTYTTVRR